MESPGAMFFSFPQSRISNLTGCCVLFFTHQITVCVGSVLVVRNMSNILQAVNRKIMLSKNIVFFISVLLIIVHPCQLQVWIPVVFFLIKPPRRFLKERVFGNAFGSIFPSLQYLVLGRRYYQILFSAASVRLPMIEERIECWYTLGLPRMKCNNADGIPDLHGPRSI